MVNVLTADAGLEGANNERRNGVEIRRYRSFAPDETIHCCPQIAVAVRNTDVDVVHAHNYHSLPLFFAALGVGDRQFVVTPHYHGESASQTRDRLLSLYHPFGRWAVRKADKVIAVSDWEHKQIETDFDIESSIIPNGVDVARFSKAEPEKQEHPYLLCVGRLEKYKGIQHLIRTLPELPSHELVVAGSGSYRDKLEQIAAEWNVSDRVTFVGYVDSDRLSKLYAGAAAYVTLSEFEAYGMTVAEALAAGTPCVVRERGALVDWVAYDGCVGVDRMTPERIAAAIEQCIDVNPIVDLPTWEEVTDQVEATYTSEE